MRTYVQKLPQIHQKHHPNYLVALVLVALVITVVGVLLLTSGVIDLPNIGQSVVPQVEDVKVDQQAAKVDPIVNQAPAVIPIEQNPIVNDPVKDVPKDEPITENNSFVTVKEETPGKTDAAANVTVPEENFIVKPDLWKKAFVLHSTDGTRTYGVGFSGISGEIKLYAPDVNGEMYVRYINEKPDGSGCGNIFIGFGAPWEPAGTMEELNDPDRLKSIVVSAYGIDIIARGQVKKGDLIAIIKPGQVVYADNFKEKATLLFTPEAKWDQGITRSEDPVEYVKQVIALIEKK